MKYWWYNSDKETLATGGLGHEVHRTNDSFSVSIIPVQKMKSRTAIFHKTKAIPEEEKKKLKSILVPDLITALK